MGRRKDRVSLAHVVFALVPDAIESVNGSTLALEEDGLDEAYADCFERVFGSRPRTARRYFSEEDASTVRTQAREAACSVKTYMSAVMLAFQASFPEGTFYAKNLTGDRALTRVLEYKAAVSKMHGNFDAETMENFLFGESTPSLEKRMLHSEIVAGEWIVAYKLKNAGSPFAALYGAKELVLDPMWLAIEPTYRKHVFDAHLKHPEKTDKDRRRWRQVVGQTMKLLKSSGRDKWGRARYLFRCREAVAAKAVERVLSTYGLRPADLEFESGVVTDMTRFWNRVGLAVQHWFCLQWSAGERGAERLLDKGED